VRAIGGPDAISLSSPVATQGVGLTTQADFVVHRGDRQYQTDPDASP
jgi:hypothetical protein